MLLLLLMMMTMLKIAITLRPAYRICIFKIHLRPLLDSLLTELHFSGIYLEHIVAAPVGGCCSCFCRDVAAGGLAGPAATQHNSYSNTTATCCIPRPKKGKSQAAAAAKSIGSLKFHCSLVGLPLAS